jgi:hypothetical protein
MGFDYQPALMNYKVYANSELENMHVISTSSDRGSKRDRENGKKLHIIDEKDTNFWKRFIPSTTRAYLALGIST